MIESSEILETVGLQGQIHYIDRYIEITLIQGHWNEIILKEESFITLIHEEHKFQAQSPCHS